VGLSIATAGGLPDAHPNLKQFSSLGHARAVASSTILISSAARPGWMEITR